MKNILITFGLLLLLKLTAFTQNITQETKFPLGFQIDTNIYYLYLPEQFNQNARLILNDVTNVKIIANLNSVINQQDEMIGSLFRENGKLVEINAANEARITNLQFQLTSSNTKIGEYDKKITTLEYALQKEKESKNKWIRSTVVAGGLSALLVFIILK